MQLQFDETRTDSVEEGEGYVSSLPRRRDAPLKGLTVVFAPVKRRSLAVDARSTAGPGILAPPLR